MSYHLESGGEIVQVHYIEWYIRPLGFGEKSSRFIMLRGTIDNEERDISFHL
jgi:hypothetical protein